MEECSHAPFRAVTIAREYGSGGGAIARCLADKLGWKLLDNTLVQEIAQRAHVNPALARRMDESVDSWTHRVTRASLWRGAFEGVAAVGTDDVFDCNTMASLAGRLIEEAYRGGDCVLVGRGAQCVLQRHADVFHVFIYAPWKQRVNRIRERRPDVRDVEEHIRATDRHRTSYIRHYFNADWANPHLYHLMVSSCLGEAAAAETIMSAMGVSGAGA